ncbi:hypothetical protein EDB86DRAFT_702445 [Lactarius hatsudake]|nr:hypothetical protein EDB86DRAFT_702445 [Lactarius hatsudake]
MCSIGLMPLPLPGLTGKASLINRGELPENSLWRRHSTKHSTYVICGSSSMIYRWNNYRDLKGYTTSPRKLSTPLSDNTEPLTSQCRLPAQRPYPFAPSGTHRPHKSKARIHTLNIPYVPFFTSCAHCLYQSRTPFKPIWRAVWHSSLHNSCMSTNRQWSSKRRLAHIVSSHNFLWETNQLGTCYLTNCTKSTCATVNSSRDGER